MKAKFDKQIADAKTDMQKAGDKMKKAGACIENDMNCCGKSDCKKK